MPKRWLPHEIEAVRGMAQVQGLSAREIARVTGCTEASITGMCTRYKIRVGGVTRNTMRSNNGGGGNYGREFYFTMYKGELLDNVR